MAANVFISEMLAPEASSARLRSCLSARVKPSVGSGSSADPPPETSAMTRSSGVRRDTRSSIRFAAFKSGGVGHRMRSFDDFDALARVM